MHYHGSGKHWSCEAVYLSAGTTLGTVVPIHEEDVQSDGAERAGEGSGDCPAPGKPFEEEKSGTEEDNCREVATLAATPAGHSILGTVCVEGPSGVGSPSTQETDLESEEKMKNVRVVGSQWKDDDWECLGPGDECADRPARGPWSTKIKPSRNGTTTAAVGTTSSGSSSPDSPGINTTEESPPVL
jgi:hypothetical protein